MPDESKSKAFPDLSAKLAAPTKKSLFERQKAEAEAKRAREQAETAAVLEDFVKSFDEDADTPSANRPPGGGRLNTFGHPGPGGFGGPAKRHFTSSGPRNSGPGSLGPPPPSLSRKRNHEGFQPLHRERDSSQGLFAFENSGPSTRDTAAAFRTSDDEERTAEAKEAERAAAKPTLYLASLPPGTSPAVVKALVPSVLTVDNVKIIPQAGQTPTERKSWSAIVTLAKESAASDIDTTVSTLQNKYLGWGFYLSISRHLSSAAISSGMPVTVGLSSSSSLPFGAKQINQNPTGPLNRAPPPGPHRGGFAPPALYGPSYGRNGPTLQVDVKPPSDLKQLRLIHKTLENLLNYGPEFEALLMSRPEVQKDEKWAWLWNPRSTGGIWYRWKLWDILTNSGKKGARPHPTMGMTPSSLLFEGGPSWVPPEKAVRFEYTTQMEEFVSDDDYNSSEDEYSDAEDDKRHGTDGPGGASDGLGYMNPLQKAKLTHLLARLPTTNAKLRRGDIARVTAFAIEHAGAGADEVVEMIVTNVLNPLAYTGANPDHLAERGAAKGEAEASRVYDNTSQENRLASKDRLDTSAAKLVGLYVISDILSSSSTSGVRHAWRYRQLFESALKSHQLFEHLGRLEKDLGWGRLKAEKWKRSVGVILNLWEGWCVFPQTSQEHFVQVFEKPPPTEEELAKEKEKAEAEKAASAFGTKGKTRWKTVEEDVSSGKFDPTKPAEAENKMDIDPQGIPAVTQDDNFDGEPMSDIDGVPMEDSDLEDLDGEEMDEDIPMNRDDSQEQERQTASEKPPERKPESETQSSTRKPRPKAEDMFADSDSE
ncbi:hypothetical protein Plec18167_006232 [Paecilomyces lecythidis]|uniref:CID domain-containing protein n=1 Tax=Paecilomyces lecythidis TaxID=3004212 RepID=A0ABR3XCN0_9EURO